MKKILLTGLTSVTLAAVPVAQSYACSNNGNGGDKHTDVHTNQHINNHVSGNTGNVTNTQTATVYSDGNVHINQHINNHVKVTDHSDKDHDKAPCNHQKDTDNHKVKQDKDHDKTPCDHDKTTPVVNSTTTLQGGKGAGPVPTPIAATTAAVVTAAPVPATPVSATLNGAVNAGAGVETSTLSLAPLAGLLGSTSILGLGVRRLLKAGR
jgi:hypothetical protein